MHFRKNVSKFQATEESRWLCAFLKFGSRQKLGCKWYY